MLERARHMRSNPTDAESRLWSILRGGRLAGLRWRRQQIVDDLYIVDFVCFAHRLVVEVDGGQHAGNEYDKRRDAWLQSQAFRVLRFWNSDILTNREGVAEAILHEIESPGARTRANPSPQPLSRKGREALEGAHNG
ncbi:endonuclease domain-containing protein [Sphingopyxis granuli]|uniref:endonuclease domain-containing protein n=1 Tax=Sphingopyxis granuli TaxID=267128 RepID=UPI0009EC50B7|nr:DUF559 domain-containing protein [Sphingopyxis granuli]